jgi:glycosyltransferase involved in cell wall biosynthesis
MRIALVHDYLNEMGGAEKVLLVLSELFPDAPIYTAFRVPGSSADKEFKHRKIVTSWFQNLPFYNKLFSPLRFLIPLIWRSFDFSKYDLVITSASWYITKGVGAKYEICYCHTPPRWLYGYATSVDFSKYWPVKIYSRIVGHFLRIYDFERAQSVNQFVANSKEVANRIRKFYRREAVVIYPPVDIARIDSGKQDYYLIISRLVGGKGLELAIEAAQKGGFKLKIAGEFAGFKKMAGVETLGRVSDQEKAKLMSEAKGFLALSKDEDFGITPVESMMCGTPVIAYNGGGYKESVVNGKTGVLFDDYSVDGLLLAIEEFEKKKWNGKLIQQHAQIFSKENFCNQVLELVDQYARTSRN